jgi:cytochrome c-type biogenesis protein CcmH
MKGRGAAALLIVGLFSGAAAAAPPEPPAGAAPAAADPRAVVGAPRGQPLGGAALDAAVQEIGAVLRCPVCQGLSIADSPTDLARDMKRQVRDLLAAGYDREQVLRYFEASYGEFVRLQPPLRGVNWLVWIAPLAGLLAGGFIVARSLRRSPAPEDAATNADGSAEASADEDVEPELLPYLLRVREMAYGWPGGHRPPATAAGAPTMPAKEEER